MITSQLLAIQRCLNADLNLSLCSVFFHTLPHMRPCKCTDGRRFQPASVPAGIRSISSAFTSASRGNAPGPPGHNLQSWWLGKPATPLAADIYTYIYVIPVTWHHPARWALALRTAAPNTRRAHVGTRPRANWWTTGQGDDTTVEDAMWRWALACVHFCMKYHSAAACHPRTFTVHQAPLVCSGASHIAPGGHAIIEYIIVIISIIFLNASLCNRSHALLTSWHHYIFGVILLLLSLLFSLRYLQILLWQTLLLWHNKLHMQSVFAFATSATISWIFRSNYKGSSNLVSDIISICNLWGEFSNSPFLCVLCSTISFAVPCGCRPSTFVFLSKVLVHGSIHSNRDCVINYYNPMDHCVLCPLVIRRF